MAAFSYILTILGLASEWIAVVWFWTIGEFSCGRARPQH
jgi:hypothetical protein